MAVWVVSDKKLSRIIKSSVAINRVYIYIKINLPGQIKYVVWMILSGYHKINWFSLSWYVKLNVYNSKQWNFVSFPHFNSFLFVAEFGTLNNEDVTSFYLDTNDHHGYHGLINEDETNVVVTPTIKVLLLMLRLG